MAISVATARFFPLDLVFFAAASGFLGIFVSNLGFFIYYLQGFFFRVRNFKKHLP